MGMIHTRKHKGSNITTHIEEFHSDEYIGRIFKPNERGYLERILQPISSTDLSKLKRDLDEKAIEMSENHDCSVAGCEFWREI
jgi:hypothetical protein